MDKNTVIERMCNSGVLPVFRTSEVQHLMAASKAIYDGGIGCVEYTMTMPGALELIEQSAAGLPRDLCLGAGPSPTATLSMRQFRRAPASSPVRALAPK